MGTSEQELRIEIACYLYQRRLLDFRKAQAVAELDLLAFQRELGKREIEMDYDIDDLKLDLKNQGIEW